MQTDGKAEKASEVAGRALGRVTTEKQKFFPYRKIGRRKKKGGKKGRRKKNKYGREEGSENH